MRALDRYRVQSAAPVVSSEITDTHVRVVGFIDEMITTMLGQNTGLNPIVRMLQRMRPALLRDLAQIPAEQLETFMVDLGRRMIEAGSEHGMNDYIEREMALRNLCHYEYEESVQCQSCAAQRIPFNDDGHVNDEVPVPVSVFGYGAPTGTLSVDIDGTL